MVTPTPTILAVAAENGFGEPEDTVEIAPQAALANLLVGVAALAVGIFLLTRAVDQPNILLIIVVVVAFLVGLVSVVGWWKLRGAGTQQITIFEGGLVHGFANKAAALAIAWPQVKVQFEQREQKRDTLTQTLNDLRLFNGDELVLHRVAPADTHEGEALARLYQRIRQEQ